MQLWKVHSNPLSSYVASPNDMSEAQTVRDSSTTTARTEDSDLNLAGVWPRGIWQRCNATDWAVRTQIEPQTRQPRVEEQHRTTNAPTESGDRTDFFEKKHRTTNAPTESRDRTDFFEKNSEPQMHQHREW